MRDEARESFERIRKSIEDEASVIFDDQDNVESAIVTDFVVVAEWMDTDGKRWLSKDIPPDSVSWRSKGLLHEALFDFDDD